MPDPSEPARSPARHPPAVLRYGVAVASVTGALVVAHLLDRHLSGAPVSLFLCAIMLSAWVGGALPGLVAVAAAHLALNLLLNGLEAMHAVTGARELLIHTGTENDACDRVHVAVRDSDTGLDPQLPDRVFEAFCTTKPHGMGMGLSISRSIVAQHGGRLWAVPNDGPGTTFHFTV
jgi:signal transduction histidine kinase